MAIASPPMNHLSLGAAMSIAKISLVVTALLASATAANVNFITVSAADIGHSYTVDYDGFTEGQVIGGLTGQTTCTLTGATGTSYSLDYTVRSEEHTSELQSLMRISYAVFCLKKR